MKNPEDGEEPSQCCAERPSTATTTDDLHDQHQHHQDDESTRLLQMGETPKTGGPPTGPTSNNNNNNNNSNNSSNNFKNVPIKNDANNNNSSSRNGKVSSSNCAKKDVNELCKELPITEETSCGLWVCKGPLLQRFANKKAYVTLYGVLGCIFSASYAYFNGTITTIEKRFKIPSKTTGIITVGNDLSQLLVSTVLAYYAGKGHRPRWIAFGIYTVVLFCCLTMLPHFLYGPGEDAENLTKEGGGKSTQVTSKLVCRQDPDAAETCEEPEGSFAPQAILFIAQLISGVGGSLYYSLGISYMDDNIQKSKTPALISFSYFLRMLGPAIGYGLASFCLKFYIDPTKTPTITTEDPRWLGAWWLGWIILAILLFIFASILALFPKTLPRAAARRALALEKLKLGGIDNGGLGTDAVEAELPASFADMMKCFKRLLKNTTLMCNNCASIFYFMGYMPYWIFMPKYIETQYKQSASASSFITGTVGLVFSAVGILLSGLVISRYKPRARYLAGWNVIVGVISVFGMIAYAFLGCGGQEANLSLAADGSLNTLLPCNADCHCDYVTYSPVCSATGETFISACHAGCTKAQQLQNGSKIYSDCKCVMPLETVDQHSSAANPFANFHNNTRNDIPLGKARSGACPIDCLKQFHIFLAIVCLLKFSGATGRASNFLVSVRCVEEKDKAVAMGFSLTIMSLFAFIPSPILFGYILDKACIVWGKTCSGTGNCWQYNSESLRYLMNFTAAGFVFIGMLFDIGVWYYVKTVKIFDDEEEEELKDIPKKPKEAT